MYIKSYKEEYLHSIN